MKNLYRKGKVHPSPPPPAATISDHLALLPATILTLTAALSPQDKEVLAYLISSCNPTSSSGNNTNNFSSGQRKVTNKNEIHRFDCDCFRCYMSYWVRWDTSPNRQLIHEIIDAYEDGQLFLHQKKNGKKMKKSERRRKRSVYHVDGGDDDDESFKVGSNMKDELDDNGVVDHHQHEGGGGGNDQVVGLEKVSMRKFVSYIGEKIWGVWIK